MVSLRLNLLRDKDEVLRSRAIVLQLPPDVIGYNFMEDPVFPVGFTTYLGQVCPIIAPLVS